MLREQIVIARLSRKMCQPHLIKGHLKLVESCPSIPILDDSAFAPMQDFVFVNIQYRILSSRESASKQQSARNTYKSFLMRGGNHETTE
jgi:hypothetical protein